MKREKKYSRKKLRMVKFDLIILMIGLLLIITSISILLNWHLFSIQKIERLDKIKDYTEYKIKLDYLNDTDIHYEKLIYENDDARFYLSGVKEMYVYYGSTQTTLQNALEKGYITLKILKNNLHSEIGSGYTKYTFKGTNEGDEQYAMYEFLRENDKTDYYFTTL